MQAPLSVQAEVAIPGLDSDLEQVAEHGTDRLPERPAMLAAGMALTPISVWVLGATSTWVSASRSLCGGGGQTSRP